MITEQGWQEITAKCQAVSNPNETAYLLLAAATYMAERDTKSVNNPEQRKSGYSTGTEFSSIINGKDLNHVLSVFEELIDTLSALSPRLHKAVLDKLKML